MSCLMPAARFAFVLLGAVAAAACGQHRVATSFAELQPRLAPGQTLYLTDTAGAQRKARLETLSASAVRFSLAGTSGQLLERDTAAISVPEPLWQGTVVGAIVGIFLGGATQQIGEAYGCVLSSDAECESNVPLAGMAIGAGLGGAIGAGLDAVMWRRTRVFSAPGVHSGLRVSPIVSGRSAGVRVSVSF